MLAGTNGGKTVECWKTYDEYLIASVTPLYAPLPTPPVLLGAEAEEVPVCAATEWRHPTCALMSYGWTPSALTDPRLVAVGIACRTVSESMTALPRPFDECVLQAGDRRGELTGDHPQRVRIALRQLRQYLEVAVSEGCRRG